MSWAGCCTCSRRWSSWGCSLHAYTEGCLVDVGRGAARACQVQGELTWHACSSSCPVSRVLKLSHVQQRTPAQIPCTGCTRALWRRQQVYAPAHTLTKTMHKHHSTPARRQQVEIAAHSGTHTCKSACAHEHTVTHMGPGSKSRYQRAHIHTHYTRKRLHTHTDPPAESWVCPQSVRLAWLESWTGRH